MKPILTAFAEFLFLAVLMVSVRFMADIDAETFIAGASENTVTQFAQEALLLVSAALFLLCAWRRPESRGFFVLVAGFFGCMFVREFNNFLDNIAPGFWVYPALLVAAVSIVYARLCGRTVLAPMAAMTHTRAYIYLSLGLLILLVFSRVFGSSSLWKDIMLSNYQMGYKKVIQEGLELLGYILIAYGSWLAYREK